MCEGGVLDGSSGGGGSGGGGGGGVIGEKESESWTKQFLRWSQQVRRGTWIHGQSVLRAERILYEFWLIDMSTRLKCVCIVPALHYFGYRPCYKWSYGMKFSKRHLYSVKTMCVRSSRYRNPTEGTRVTDASK